MGIHATSKECDLFVAGTGMAGMASALFAAKRGLSVVQAGSTGEIIFASGLFDLMAVHPIADKKLWDDPWAAVDAVSADEPNHPYAKLDRATIEKGYDELLAFLSQHGVHYYTRKNENLRVVTPVGTTKHTWAVPETMRAGVEAFERKAPVLLVDFEGLREFSAKQIATTLSATWPGIRTARVEFPGVEGMKPILTGIMGQAMELKATRDALCELIRPHLSGVEAVGLPAILGIYTPGDILKEMEEALGVAIFEIPTLPASVPGLRLKAMFEGHIAEEGVELKLQNKVFSVEPQADGRYLVSYGVQGPEEQVLAKGVMLASGRFIGGGLIGKRNGVTESVMNLPVAQPVDRHGWHCKDMFDAKGHGISKAGVETDASFRPVDAQGTVLYDSVFAVGTLLAHQDWMRMKCGTGLAVGTAMKAVEAFAATVKG